MIGPRRLDLTDAQRQQIEQARTLAASEAEAIAGLGDTGTGNAAAVYAIAYGRTQAAITALLGIIDELDGGGAS